MGLLNNHELCALHKFSVININMKNCQEDARFVQTKMLNKDYFVIVIFVYKIGTVR